MTALDYAPEIEVYARSKQEFVIVFRMTH